MSSFFQRSCRVGLGCNKILAHRRLLPWNLSLVPLKNAIAIMINVICLTNWATTGNLNVLLWFKTEKTGWQRELMTCGFWTLFVYENQNFWPWAPQNWVTVYFEKVKRNREDWKKYWVRYQINITGAWNLFNIRFMCLTTRGWKLILNPCSFTQKLIFIPISHISFQTIWLHYLIHISQLQFSIIGSLHFNIILLKCCFHLIHKCV